MYVTRKFDRSIDHNLYRYIHHKNLISCLTIKINKISKKLFTASSFKNMRNRISCRSKARKWGPRSFRVVGNPPEKKESEFLKWLSKIKHFLVFKLNILKCLKWWSVRIRRS